MRRVTKGWSPLPSLRPCWATTPVYSAGYPANPLRSEWRLNFSSALSKSSRHFATTPTATNRSADRTRRTVTPPEIERAIFLLNQTKKQDPGHQNPSTESEDFKKKEKDESELKYYATLLTNCVAGDRMDLALKLFAKMREVGFYNVHAWTAVMRGYIRQDSNNTYNKKKGMEAALALFEEMREAGVSPTIVTYNTLLDGFVKGRDLEKALHLFERMKKEAGTDVVSYSTLIGGYMKARWVSTALRLYEEMERRGVTPNLWTFSALIGGLVESQTKADKLEENMRIVEDRLLKRMAELGITMNVVTYSGVIEGFVTLGRMDKAEKYWQEMQEKNKVDPNALTYGSMIKGYMKTGQTDMAEKLVEQMRARKLVVTRPTYNSLIDGYAKAGNLERAIEVLEEVKKVHGPDWRNYHAFLNGLVDFGQVKKAEELFRSWRISEDSKEPQTPVRDIYNLLIRGYANDGDTENATRLLKEMEESGVPPDEQTFRHLANLHISEGRPVDLLLDQLRTRKLRTEPLIVGFVDNLVKEGREDEAEALLADYQKKNLISDWTPYLRLLDAHAANERWDKMIGLLSLLGDKNLLPTTSQTRRLQEFVILLVKAGRISDCVRLLDNHLPSSSTSKYLYTILLDSYMKKKEVDKAVELFDKMKAKGIAADKHIYGVLVLGLAGAGRLDEAEALLKEVEGSMEAFTYNSLLHGWLRKGEARRALQVLKRMKEDGVVVDEVTCRTVVVGVKALLSKAKEEETLKKALRELVEEVLLEQTTAQPTSSSTTTTASSRSSSEKEQLKRLLAALQKVN